MICVSTYCCLGQSSADGAVDGARDTRRWSASGLLFPWARGVLAAPSPMKTSVCGGAGFEGIPIRTALVFQPWPARKTGRSRYEFPEDALHFAPQRYHCPLIDTSSGSPGRDSTPAPSLPQAQMSERIGPHTTHFEFGYDDRSDGWRVSFR